MDPLSIVGLLSILAIVVLGLVTLRTNPRNFLNRAFCYLAISVGLWALIVFFENGTTSQKLATFLTRSDFFVGGLLLMFWVLFSWSFKHQGKTPRRGPTLVLLTLTALFCAACYTNLFIKNIRIDQAVAFDRGPLFSVFIAFFLAMGVGSLVLTAQKYFKSTGLERSRALYVLIGFLLTFLGVLATLVVYPQVAEPTVAVSRFGISSLAFLMGFSAYAVLRYRLMDVTILIRRTASYLILIALILATYALSIFLLGNALKGQLHLADRTAQIISLVVLVLCIFPLKALMDRYINRYLFRGIYNQKKFLEEAESLLSLNQDLGQATSALSRHLCEAMGLTYAVFLVFSESDAEDVILKSGWHLGSVPGEYSPFTLEASQVDILLLNQDRIVVRDELNRRLLENQASGFNRAMALLRQMEDLSSEIAVPITFQHRASGLLVIGEKVNRRDFSIQDVDFLKKLMQRVAYVVDHHRLYEELKHNYEELDLAYEQLKDIDRFKSDIITITNHELRGPLTLIKGYLDLLNARMEDFDERTQHELLALAKKGTDRLAQIVDDLRVVTDIETGRLYVDTKELDLHRMALEAESSLAVEPPARFNYDFALDLPSVYGDREKVVVVLHNLMDNAHKFAGKYGPIHVGAYADSDGVVVFVKDKGPGMRKEYLDSIFGLFSFIGDSDHHSQEGLGLGLYVARRLVEMHSGRIWGESEIDQGSSFFFMLPAQKVTQPEAQPLEERHHRDIDATGGVPQGDGGTMLHNLSQDGYLGWQG